MSNKISAFYVVLDQDVYEEDAVQIKQAILALKLVAAVTPIESSFESAMATERARMKLAGKIWDVLYPKILEAEV